MKRNSAGNPRLNNDNQKNSISPIMKEKQDRPVLKNGIYFTKIQDLPNDANKNAYSLYEVINMVNPVASIHFNYCIDVEFLLSQYPRRCRSSPITLVVGQQDFQELRNSAADYKNVTVTFAPIPFPYGTHHTKLTIFESEDAIHVMVSTANLIENDYGLKTQCFYYCRAPFLSSLNEKNDALTSSNSASILNNKFSSDLVTYLEEAYVKTGNTSVIYWVQRIRDGGADFRNVSVRLIASRPGRFIAPNLSNYGHMRLRTLLAEKFDSAELERQITKIAQFSSIGSLGTQAQSWLCDEFLRSLCGNNTTNMNPVNLKLVYPSAYNVRRSFEGYYAGNSLPYRTSVNSKQPYLLSFLHHWKNDKLKRSRAMPHVKSYTALDYKTGQPQWLLITSANLSQAAWGKLEKNETQLFCRSYELGVLVCLKDEPNLSLLTLPYELPLVKYSAEDRPYMVDETYTEPDAKGFFSPFEYRLLS